MSPDTLLTTGLPCAVIDCETTDLPDNDPHICGVAVVHCTLGQSPKTARVAFSSLVRPPVPIPEKASSIHGIRDADVADAPRWADIVGAVVDACEGRVLVAFNAPADFAFVRAEMARIGVRPPGGDGDVGPDLLTWPWLDLLVVRKATKTRGRPGRLIEIAEEYGVVLDAHGATGDALTTALLLSPMWARARAAGAFAGPAGASSFMRRGDEDWDDDEDEDKPPDVTTLGAYWRWQRGAALYQERDFHAWARRSGWATPPSCAWHALECVEPPPWPARSVAAPCPACSTLVTRRVGKDGSLYTADAEGGAAHACTGAP